MQEERNYINTTRKRWSKESREAEQGEDLKKYKSINQKLWKADLYETGGGIDNDPYGTKKEFPLGSIVTGKLNPDGKTYKGKVVGYSKSSDDIYILNDNNKKIKLVGISVSKFANGGMTEHGLKRGDTIVYNSGNEVMVVDKNKNQKLIDLDKGQRYVKGGQMHGWKHKMKTGGGVGEHKNPTLNDSCTITVEGNIKMQPSDSYKPVYENDVLMLRVYKSSDKDGAYDVQLFSTNKLWQEFDFKQRRKRSKNYVDEVKSQVSSLLQKDNVKLKSLKMIAGRASMETGGGIEMGSWFDENPNPGNEIKNPSKYSEDDLLKASKKIKGADVSVYDDTLEVNIEDQSYYYGYSDVEDCWTGSYHVDGDLQVSIPMDLNQFIAQVQDAMSYLG
jgi:hypothetical protein